MDNVLHALYAYYTFWNFIDTVMRRDYYDFVDEAWHKC